MRVDNILSTGKYHISLEVFPPKKDTSFEQVMKAVKELANLNPSFMSCTYGAGGGTSENTAAIANNIQSYGIPSVAHLTCINSDIPFVEDQIRLLKGYHIENIMALRGDKLDSTENPAFNHAINLIKLIRVLYPEACIGGACYPEKHPDAASKEEDLFYLKEKQDAGCDYFVTQMFFDNSNFYNFLFRAREAGITVPILAGIMPVTSTRQMHRSIELSGCTIPQKFKSMVDMFGNNPKAMEEVGIIYATEQILDLLANGITDIHLYTMNKPQVAKAILETLHKIIE